MKLTDISIKALKPPERGQQLYLDDTLSGFGVRVSQGGTKTFILVHGRRRRKLTIGRYPTISLSHARTEAKRLLAEFTLGKRQDASTTFEKALPLFLAPRPDLSDRTLDDYTRLLNRHFSKPLRYEHLNEISTNDLTKILDKLTATPSERFHAANAIKIFFNWAKRRKYVPTSPAETIDVPKPQSRERVLTDAEIVQVWKASDQLNHQFGNIVKLLILLGQRRTITGALHSSHFTADWTITFPAKQTKNKKRPHMFPYGDMAAAIFETLPKTGYVFPSAEDPRKPYARWNKGKAALDKLCPIAAWTLHDLRRTFRTKWAELGIPKEVAKKYVNHVLTEEGDEVDSIYNRHHYMPEMVMAVKAWEARLQKLLQSC